jgi:hypothetical protein
MLSRILLALALLPGVARAEKTFAKGTSDTWDCAKDAVVTIKVSNGTYGFLGDCKRITVSGGKNAVSVATVGKLVVTGSDNHVDVDQVDAIAVGGTRNTVRWKKTGNGDKPKISVHRKTNQVEQQK